MTIKLIFFIITYLFSGLIATAFFKTILKRHKEIISPGEILILGFGLGPIIISLILCLLFLFLPNKANLFYILIVSVIFLLMLFIGRRNILEGKEFLAWFKGIRNLEKDIILIVAIVSIVMLYIFIVGINFPIVTHDASTYGYYGKYLYQEKNLSHYPMRKPDEKTGAYLKVRHPPGFPLIYTWFYLLQGNTDSDILARTVSPMYGLYLIILLWIVLRTRKNKYCSAFGILLMALTPLFIQQSCCNTIDPTRMYLIFFSFILLAKFLNSESFILALLTIIVLGLSLYLHTAGLLVLLTMIILYLLLTKKSIKRRIILAVLMAIVLGGVRYGTKHIKFSPPILRTYLSLLRTNFSFQRFEYSHFKKIAALGKRRTEVISEEPEEWLRRIFYERGQVFSTPIFFGLSYYIFLFALFYWIGYIHKKRLDLVLLLGAILFAIPVIYRYWLNNRYIFTIHPIIAYFGGLAIGSVYSRLRNGKFKGLWPVVLIPLIVMMAWHVPLSIVRGNYVKFGAIKKVIRYIFADQKEKLQNTSEVFQAIEFINTQTPEDSVVLVFRDGRYFYNAERKGICYYDPRLKSFYRSHNTEEAYRYLLNLGVNYIMTDPQYVQCSAFKDSELKNILKDKKMSQLVYENWAAVYEIRWIPDY